MGKRKKDIGKKAHALAAMSGDPLAHLAGCLPADQEQVAALRAQITCCAQCQLQRAEPKLQTCGRCLRVHYCSIDCQRQHWAAHKPFCIPAPNPTAPPPVLPTTTPSAPAATTTSSTPAGDPRDTMRMCHGCRSFVAQIDWFKQGRCQLCRNPSYVRPVPAAGSQTPTCPALLADLARKQRQLQAQNSACLRAAFTKSFSLRHSSHIRLAPVAYAPNTPIDLASVQTGDKYEVAYADPTSCPASVHFKFIGMDTHHACALPVELTALLQDERFQQGGIHYFLQERAFWSMVLNYHNHGSTIPFPGPCANRCCRSAPVPNLHAQWQKLQGSYDALFAAALADPNSVRCMFVDTPIGCCDEACPFAGHTRGAP